MPTLQPLSERGLKIGQKAELTWVAKPTHAITLGRRDQATVFSTPSMIHLMEQAARKLLAPHLDAQEESVGVDVNIAHLAATPIGGPVRATAELIGLNRRAAEFAVSAYDAKQQIGQGSHTRAVVDIERFTQHLYDEAAPAKSERDPAISANSDAPTKTTEPVGKVAPGSDLQPRSGPLPTLKNLQLRAEGPIGILVNHRPHALNALHPDTLEDFDKLLPWLADQAGSLRVLIVTGAGKSFCAGSDLHAVQAMSLAQASDFGQRQGRLANHLAALPQPVIAAINGYAFGGGCTLAAACDFRLASTTATFSMPEIKLGWPGGWGMSQLYRYLGHARMTELCLTGQTINARTASEWGLLHRVVPAGRLLGEARRLAAELAAQPPLALRENKWLMHHLAGVDARESFLAEDAAYLRCLNTSDAREGLAAFLEKRPPNFTGK
ncbi:MAG: enoyl-CoA hydratase-related protein [Opitutales bacterium]